MYYITIKIEHTINSTKTLYNLIIFYKKNESKKGGDQLTR